MNISFKGINRKEINIGNMKIIFDKELVLEIFVVFLILWKLNYVLLKFVLKIRFF